MRDLRLGLAALRNQLVTRDDLEPFVKDVGASDLGEALYEKGLITEAEKEALEVIEEGRRRRGQEPLSMKIPKKEESETMELQPAASPAPEMDDADLMTPCKLPDERYTILDEVGRGGIGVVYNAFDHNLQRHLALKVALPGKERSSRRERFLREARLSGQLQHPNIVPVYDMGELGENLPYFSMRLVRGRSLAEVLDALRSGDESVEKRFSRWRFLAIFQAVCMGIAYAHDKGIVHRDLKPENIMIGDFGEVLIMDWGLAKYRDQDEIRSAGEGSGSPLDSRITAEGTILGTPIYMSPEQAEGKLGEIDERSDIYSLGTILYEILTFRLPFDGSDVGALLDKVVREEPKPPSRRATETRRIHPELDRICLKALQKKKKDRYASVRALHDDIQRYAEGAKERLRRREEAREAVEEGKKLAERYFAMREVVRRYEKTLEATAKKFKGWEPVEEKKELWVIEDQLERMAVLKGRRFADAVNKFVSALEFESDNREAREVLAQLYWGRFLEAEEKGDQAGVNYFLATAKFFNDGVLDEALKGDGTLTLETDPPGATVLLSRYRERGRILRPERIESFPASEGGRRTIPMGSYLLELDAPGKARTRLPLLVRRGEDRLVEGRMFTDDEIGEGFVHVPAGPFVSGGDPHALAPKPRSAQVLPDYFIAVFPVTCRAYLAYLNSLPPDRALSAVPVEPGTGRPLWARNDEGVFALPGPGTKTPFAWIPEMPVIAVSWHMAKAYCVWRSERDGRAYAMPTEAQWEKAARGVDGRVYPWGDKFDPTYCKNSRSRPGPPAPEAVGAYPVDASPYGVRDMAGGVREWCETESDALAGVRSIRGGSWVNFSTATRCASRFGDASFTTSYVYGFRLASVEPATK